MCLALGRRLPIRPSSSPLPGALLEQVFYLRPWCWAWPQPVVPMEMGLPRQHRCGSDTVPAPPDTKETEAQRNATVKASPLAGP